MTKLQIDFVETKVERLDAIATVTSNCLHAIATLQEWSIKHPSVCTASDIQMLNKLRAYIQATQRHKLRTILNEDESPKISDRSMDGARLNTKTGYDAVDSQLSGLSAGDKK